MTELLSLPLKAPVCIHMSPVEHANEVIRHLGNPQGIFRDGITSHLVTASNDEHHDYHREKSRLI